MADEDSVEDPKYNYLDVLGSTGLKRSGGYVDEEWLNQLKGERGVKVYTEMKDNDPVIGAILYAIKTLIRQTEYKIQPSGDTPLHQELSDFVESCLEDMSVTWPDFISEVLSFLPFGWSYFETLYKVRRGDDPNPKFNSKFNDGKVGWRKFAIRAQNTLYHWEFTEEGEILGMWQISPPDFDPVFLPISKCLLFRTGTHKNNPEGRSILRNAYRSWYFMKRIQEIEAIGVERDLAGLPVMQVPLELLSSNATAAQKSVVEDFRDLIQKIRRDEYEGVVIPSETDFDGSPSGFKLSLLASGGRRPVDVNEIIKRYESRVALSVLGEFILLGLDAHGSFSLSSNKTALFAQSLGVYLQSVAAVFNEQAISRIMKLNGHSDPTFYPELTFSDIETPELAELAGALTGLTGAGLITPDDKLEEWIREYANLPTSDIGSAREVEEPVQFSDDIDEDMGPING